MLLQQISTWITSVIVSSGYLGIAGLSLVGSAAIPIPSEVVMPFAGFLVSQGHFGLLYVVLAAAIGSVLGSLILYGIGYHGGKEFIEKYGKYLLMSQHDVARAEKFFERHGNIANFIGRFIPVLRTYISLPAGIAKNKPAQFVLYAFLGSFIWSFALAYVGYKFGQRWGVASAELSKFSDAIVVVIALALAYYVYRHIKNFNSHDRK